MNFHSVVCSSGVVVVLELLFTLVYIWTVRFGMNVVKDFCLYSFMQLSDYSVVLEREWIWEDSHCTTQTY